MNSSSSFTNPHWNVGVARRIITPGKHVELAGPGYYLNRTPDRVRDDPAATALAIEDHKGKSVALVAVDIMYADENFTRSTRERVAAGKRTGPNATGGVW